MDISFCIPSVSGRVPTEDAARASCTEELLQTSFSVAEAVVVSDAGVLPTPAVSQAAAAVQSARLSGSRAARMRALAPPASPFAETAPRPTAPTLSGALLAETAPRPPPAPPARAVTPVAPGDGAWLDGLSRPHATTASTRARGREPSRAASAVSLALQSSARLLASIDSALAATPDQTGIASIRGFAVGDDAAAESNADAASALGADAAERVASSTDGAAFGRLARSSLQAAQSLWGPPPVAEVASSTRVQTTTVRTATVNAAVLRSSQVAQSLSPDALAVAYHAIVEGASHAAREDSRACSVAGDIDAVVVGAADDAERLRRAFVTADAALRVPALSALGSRLCALGARVRAARVRVSGAVVYAAALATAAHAATGGLGGLALLAVEDASVRNSVAKGASSARETAKASPGATPRTPGTPAPNFATSPPGGAPADPPPPAVAPLPLGGPPLRSPRILPKTNLGALRDWAARGRFTVEYQLPPAAVGTMLSCVSFSAAPEPVKEDVVARLTKGTGTVGAHAVASSPAHMSPLGKSVGMSTPMRTPGGGGGGSIFPASSTAADVSPRCERHCTRERNRPRWLQLGRRTYICPAHSCALL